MKIFNSCELDVVINCIGIGNPQKIMNNTEELQTVTKSFDEKIFILFKRFFKFIIYQYE